MQAPEKKGLNYKLTFEVFKITYQFGNLEVDSRLVMDPDSKVES